MPRKRKHPAKDTQTDGILRASVRFSFGRGASAGSASRLLSELREEDVLENVPSHQQIRDRAQYVRKSWLLKEGTVVKLPLRDGGVFDWVTLRPVQALQQAADSVPWFRQALAARLPEHGGPVRMAFYADEVVPGNPLAPNPTRRCVAFYMTLLPFRDLMLSDKAWLTVAILRTSTLERTMHGLTGCVSLLLEQWLPDFRGLPLRLSDTDCRMVQLELSALVGDEAALAGILAAKGAAGRKPCWLCRNLISRGAPARIQHGEGRARAVV